MKRRKALRRLHLRDFPPAAKRGAKAALTTGMTTDRKIFIFITRRGIMAEIEYPGIAKLVSRLLWEQDAVGSNSVTRTTVLWKTAFLGGFPAL